jgi:Uma2 family endonuclease
MAMPAVKQWTLEELHSLPDDGNKYELVRGVLFVTPPPTNEHETILARLTRMLEPYVAARELGFIYHPRSVVRHEGSEVEPDLMVRAPLPHGASEWDEAPCPILVVEVLSPSTRRRDQTDKRDFYIAVGVSEYWVIDPERQTVRVFTPVSDVTYGDEVVWTPLGAAPLVIPVARLFS